VTLSATAFRHLAAARAFGALAALLLGIAMAPPPALGQTAPGAPAAASEEAKPRGPEDPYERGTPRSAMHGFLAAARAGEWTRAAQYLDLRSISAGEREARGPELARQLKIILDRTLWVDLDALSDDPAGARDDGLPAHRELVGHLEATEPPLPILLDRVPREDDGVRIWKVSGGTLRQVPELWDRFGDGPLAEWLPQPFFTWTFLQLQLWQWIGLLVLAAAAGLGGAIAVWIVSRIFSPLLRRAASPRAMLAPAGALLALGLFSAGRFALQLSVPADRVLSGLSRGGVVLVITWMLFRLVDAAELGLRQRLRSRGQASAEALLTMGRRTAKALLVAIAFLAVLQNLGVNVTGLLAGLGIGGVAVALAAQKSIENLFGGVTLIGDQPVRVGDFCRFGDRVGTVEDIGLRSTRIRTLDRTVVTVPNAELSSMQLENYAKRDRFWFHPTLGLRYETTAEQLRYVLVELRKLLYAHPKVSPEPARVRFAGFGSSSLDVEVFAYVLARDYDEYLEVAEDLNLRIMDVVAAAGTGFAFPSQTVYVRPDEGLDAEAAKRAEQAVARVAPAFPRASCSLPARRCGATEGVPARAHPRARRTLDYPPKGSALRREPPAEAADAARRRGRGVQCTPGVETTVAGSMPSVRQTWVQSSSSGTSKTASGASGAITQAPCASSPSSWPGPQPA
jgi:MscS family membrane protein